MIPPCPKCGFVANKPGARFCVKCGAQISGPTEQLPSGQPPSPPPATPPPATPAPPPTPPTMVPCSHCGTPNRQGARFCKQCRQPLPQATMPGVTPPPAPPPPPPRPIQPTPQMPAPVVAPVTPPPYTPPAPVVAPVPPAPAPRPRSPVMGVLGLIALTLCLCVSLAGILAVDATRVTPVPTINVALLTPSATPTVPPPPTPVPAPTIVPTPTPNPPYPVVSMQITPKNGRFGFMTKEGDPNNPNDDNKPLTFRIEKSTLVPDGHTNNTRVQVDDKTPLFGDPQSGFVISPTLNAEGSRMLAVWQFNRVVFTQTVFVAQSSSTNRLDAFRIQYDAENRDTVAHSVGVRLMIDTLIGDNDGVPFNVPSRGTGVITSPLDLRGSDIPDYVQVYELPENPDAGVKVQITLKGGDATPPDRFVIAPWCNKDAGWNFLDDVGGLANRTLHQCGDAGKQDDKLDSAVGIYFDAKPLAPGEMRRWTTFYGLGMITYTDPTSALAIALGQHRVTVGDQFWVTALVRNPKAGQRVRIDLPPELERVRNDVEQVVPQVGAALTQVSWLVQAKQPKTGAEIKVTLSLVGATPTMTMQTERVTIIPAPVPTPTPTRTRAPCTPSPTNPVCP